MTEIASPAVVPGLVEAVRRKLQDAPSPLKIKEVMSKLKPRKLNADDFQAEVRRLLDDEVRSGQAFRYPSGAKGAERFWARDEKQAIRDEVLRAAASPIAAKKLHEAAKKAVQGTDTRFVEKIVGELIAEGKLFKHQVSARSFQFSSQPQSVLEQPQFKKLVKSFTDSARKLREEAKQPLDELIALLRKNLSSEAASTPTPSPVPVELDELILKAVATEGGSDGTVAIAGLRRQMPAEYRGAAFDEAIFRLTDLNKVFLLPDNRSGQLSAEELHEMVKDANGTYFCQVGLRE
jgi:hypothetical protein